MPHKMPRLRSTKAQVQGLEAGLREIVEAQRPMTVRQAFYQAASVWRLVDKTEAGYAKVQIRLTLMRRSGVLPYGWITDSTRWQRRPITYDGIQNALEETARFYRKSLWAKADCYVEIWLEKDALVGVIDRITSEYDVPLMVARGYSSLSFLHSSAEYISGLRIPTYIYHLGDYDPSGVNASETIERTLREMAPRAEIHFERIGVTPEQIANWNLPTRPTKPADTRAKRFGSSVSVELDAIEPDMLRTLVRTHIEQHLPADQLRVLLAAEASERQFLREIVGELFRDDAP